MNRVRNPHALVGTALILLGLGLFVSSLDIDVSPAVVLLGPRLFPSIVAVGLVILGTLTVATALTSRSDAQTDGETDAEPENDWPAFLTALAGPVLFLIAVEPLGFAIAAALLFSCVARAFGSRRAIVDLAIGLVLGAVILVVFSRGLGLALPMGAVFNTLLGAG